MWIFGCGTESRPMRKKFWIFWILVCLTTKFQSFKGGKTLFFLRLRGLRAPLSADECLCTARWWKSDHPFHHPHIRTDLSGYIQIKIHRACWWGLFVSQEVLSICYIHKTKFTVPYHIWQWCSDPKLTKISGYKFPRTGNHFRNENLHSW